MREDRGVYLDRNNDVERCLVRTSHSIVREDDVTSWSSVFRVLLELTVAALVLPAPRKPLGAGRSAGRSLAA